MILNPPSIPRSTVVLDGTLNNGFVTEVAFRGGSFSAEPSKYITPVQSQVLALGAIGMSPLEIGILTYRGENTIKTHYRRMYSALGTHTLNQTIAFAFDHEDPIFSVTDWLPSLGVEAKRYDIDIIRGLGLGLNREELGDFIGLGTKQTKTHLVDLRKRLDIHDRTSASLVTLGHLIGILPCFGTGKMQD